VGNCRGKISVKNILRRFYFYGAWLFAKSVLVLPFGFAVKIGGTLGLIGYYVAGQARKIAIANISRAFPEMPPVVVRTTAKQVFINQGKNAFELFSYPRLTNAKLMAMASIENAQALQQALSNGKGVLIASAHCGNWEILGAALAAAGFKINVIAKRIYIEGLNNMLVGFRESKQVKVILRSEVSTARQMLRALRNNESIGMLIDQDTSVPGVFVNFFGKDAYTPSGMASLAVKTGAAVVLALDVRNPDDSHTVKIWGPIEPHFSGKDEADIAELTKEVTAMTEAHIRLHPDQWVWMHDRWKTQNQSIGTR
jgi:KDO2-lipid IV(A) lauroyltransferase